jgi:Na+/proline symporter
VRDAVNLAVIVADLVAIAVIGLKLSGRQRSATEYFTGLSSLPWWAVMFSIVATETSSYQYLGQRFGPTPRDSPR